jgi:hypothetical protein
MASVKKLGLFVFLTLFLTLTVAILARAQTATPPMPREVLLGAITEQAQRDEQKGVQESTEGLNLLFGEQMKQTGMTLPEVKKIYEDAYSASAAAKPWYADLVPPFSVVDNQTAPIWRGFRVKMGAAGQHLVESGQNFPINQLIVGWSPPYDNG